MPFLLCTFFSVPVCTTRGILGLGALLGVINRVFLPSLSVSRWLALGQPWHDASTEMRVRSWDLKF